MSLSSFVRIALVAGTLAWIPLSQATPGDDPLVPLATPYDPEADADAAIDGALEAARETGRIVLVQFGANWCPDCRQFATLLEDPTVKPMVADAFVVAKVDVGNWDNNLDVAERYGNPIANGIPAAVFLDENGEVVAATLMGELSTARNFEAADVIEFLQGILARGTDGAG
ncbi:MAG: thioredoxin family protein [Pseudomonadales bacterium]|jgi:protein disulfide-isomerase|nr:thioredoxin family protein [Pseudomonadales bacterium]